MFYENSRRPQKPNFIRIRISGCWPYKNQKPATKKLRRGVPPKNVQSTLSDIDLGTKSRFLQDQNDYFHQGSRNNIAPFSFPRNLGLVTRVVGWVGGSKCLSVRDRGHQCVITRHFEFYGGGGDGGCKKGGGIPPQSGAVKMIGGGIHPKQNLLEKKI